jgi:hypothetical protein
MQYNTQMHLVSKQRPIVERKWKSLVLLHSGYFAVKKSTITTRRAYIFDMGRMHRNSRTPASMARLSDWSVHSQQDIRF